LLRRLESADHTDIRRQVGGRTDHSISWAWYVETLLFLDPRQLSGKQYRLRVDSVQIVCVELVKRMLTELVSAFLDRVPDLLHQ
jgi:hypothetical protein